VTTDRELTVPQAHPDPVIDAMRQDIAAIKSALLGATDGSRLGLHARVTAIENQWGKVYALMSIPVGALLMIAVNSVFGGKHP
jgi:hypothetical protein